MSAEMLLIILCGMIVLSYLLSILSRYVRVPSVLLLLFAGIGIRLITDAEHIAIPLPRYIVEGLGVIGLIMIVLEAGLDLKLHKGKLKMIRNSFLASLILLILSTALLTAILYFWLHENAIKCIVYALPLSIMSSSIVLPSIHRLTEEKKEFLIYEASFSDILGIVFFNYFTAADVFTVRSFGFFGLNIGISVVLSFLFSLLLLLILARTKMNIKFFLIFALLILIYTGGKMMHLPSLLIILVFGLMINNWEAIPLKRLRSAFGHDQVEGIRSLLHSITAESSFLVRTFFFLFFGYTIDLSFLGDVDVLLIGSLMVLALFLVRLIYFKFFSRTRAFPEAFFVPRGLITIVLFYKIPGALKLTTFNDGILFFVVLSTGLILSVGMIFYRQKNSAVVEEPQFLEQKDTL